MGETLARENRVSMMGIVKTFGNLIALSGVDFDLLAGEIHALVGENGAGKSTLMHILSGLYRHEEGEISLKGKRITLRSPRDAIRLGINMVHQHFMLFPTFTVWENILMGTRSSIEIGDFKTHAERLQPLLERFQLDPFTEVWKLPISAQQRIEIVRALYRDTKVLILDEPTSVLVPAEVEDLFSLLESLTAEGISIVFVSHKIKEVIAISQRVTVLRKGRTIGTVPTREASEEQLIQMMIGTSITSSRKPGKPCQDGVPILEVRNLSARNDRNLKSLDAVSLQVNSGEILGIAGVDGNGQKELAEAIVGLRPVTDGQILIGGKDCTALPLVTRLGLGMAYTPEDCLHSALFGDFSLQDNFLVKHIAASCLLGGRFFIHKKTRQRMIEETEAIIARYDMRADSETPAKFLSGGNQQKFSMHMALSANPKILVALYPTKGLDVRSVQNMHEKIIDETTRGSAVLFFSNELSEILSISDRISVLYEGRIMALLQKEETDIERIGSLMAGIG